MLVQADISVVCGTSTHVAMALCSQKGCLILLTEMHETDKPKRKFIGSSIMCTSLFSSQTALLMITSHAKMNVNCNKYLQSYCVYLIKCEAYSNIDQHTFECYGYCLTSASIYVLWTYLNECDTAT